MKSTDIASSNGGFAELFGQQTRLSMDSFPTSLVQVAQRVIAALHVLERTLIKKAEEFDTVNRLGRTSLQDADPLTVGQTHRAQPAALQHHRTELQDAAGRLLAVPLGATVIGTGVGAPEGYSALAINSLAELSADDLTVSAKFLDALSHLDPYVPLASALVRPAITLTKITSDRRILSSGPMEGFGEVDLPARRAGLSVMPGQVHRCDHPQQPRNDRESARFPAVFGRTLGNLRISASHKNFGHPTEARRAQGDPQMTRNLRHSIRGAKRGIRGMKAALLVRGGSQ